jgi:hypothetical protein
MLRMSLVALLLVAAWPGRAAAQTSPPPAAAAQDQAARDWASKEKTAEDKAAQEIAKKRYDAIIERQERNARRAMQGICMGCTGGFGGDQPRRGPTRSSGPEEWTGPRQVPAAPYHVYSPYQPIVPTPLIVDPMRPWRSDR